jgi:hypothetical protein
MIHEINTLVKALIKNEKKHVKVQDTFSKRSRELKKIIKLQNEEHNLLEQKTEDL